ncbi:hypothetical protein [Microcystis sp. BLCC-F209]
MGESKGVTISYQSSVISYQLSVISYQLSAKPIYSVSRQDEV